MSVRQLVNERYDVYNVNEHKQPINRNGFGLKNWESLPYDVLVKHHNYKSKLWGIRLGQQTNGKYILSLDFDVCGKPNEEGKRTGCPDTQKLLDEYQNNIDRKDGMFSSSTEGNYNVLVDYSVSNQIKEWVANLGKAKFAIHELEILVAKNQIIPPSATNSKITGNIGPAREFMSENNFYVMEKEEGFMFEFLQRLFTLEKGPGIEEKQISKPETKPKRKYKLIVKDTPEDTPQVETHIETTSDLEKFKLISQCYSKERLSKYDSYIQFTMAVKNTFGEQGKKIWEDIIKIGKNRDGGDFNEYQNNEQWFKYNPKNKEEKNLKFGSLMKWAKEDNPELYKQILNINGKEIDGVKNDLEAAEVVYKLYPHWVFCKGVLYVFNENTGIWEDSKTAYYDVIKRYTNNLYVMTEVNGDWKKSKSKSYGNTVSLMDKIPILMPTLCTNNNWLRDKQNSSLGKLLFNNGYYDYHKGLFYDKETYGFNPEILFMGKVHHDFTPFTDEELVYMDDIRKRFFYDTLGEDAGNYFILNLARGLAGDMVKRLLFALGPTNTGKTVLCEALTATCGDYIGSFNAENLAYRNTSNDEAQIMRWALLLRYKRIIFSNEMKSNCDLNGNMIKKISSGGDTLIGRRHCQEEEEFNTHFLSICFANDLMKIKPYDDAVNGRVRIIPYTKQFVEGEPTNALELKMDKNIKHEIKTLKFQRVFMGLLIRAYNKFHTEDGRVEIEPAEVMVAKDDWVGQGATPIDAFFEEFEVTNNPDDYVRSKDIEEWLMEKQLGITMKKFGMEMKKLCIIRKYENVRNYVKKLGGKTTQVWYGIKYIQYESDNAEDNTP